MFPSHICQWMACLLVLNSLVLFFILKHDNDLKHYLPPSSRISGIPYQCTGSLEPHKESSCFEAYPRNAFLHTWAFVGFI